MKTSTPISITEMQAMAGPRRVNARNQVGMMLFAARGLFRDGGQITYLVPTWFGWSMAPRPTVNQQYIRLQRDGAVVVATKHS